MVQCHRTGEEHIKAGRFPGEGHLSARRRFLLHPLPQQRHFNQKRHPISSNEMVLCTWLRHAHGGGRAGLSAEQSAQVQRAGHDQRPVVTPTYCTVLWLAAVCWSIDPNMPDPTIATSCQAPTIDHHSNCS